MPVYTEHRIFTYKDGVRKRSQPVPEELMLEFNQVSKELRNAELAILDIKARRNALIVRAGLEAE